HEGKVKYPFDMLTQTAGLHPLRYNEMIIEGHEKTKIGGVFFKNFKFEIENHARLLKDTINEKPGNKIPLVEVPFIGEEKNPETNPEKRKLWETLKKMKDDASRSVEVGKFYNPEKMSQPEFRV
ncbi:MAG: hypothetical protein JSV92_00550, partial [archaeon]